MQRLNLDIQNGLSKRRQPINLDHPRKGWDLETLASKKAGRRFQVEKDFG